MLEVHRCRQIDWAPSAIVALATSFDGTVVAAARENGAIEIWSVAAGSVGWHCQLKIAGRKDAAVSSLVWCQPGAEDEPRGRLFSAALDGFITEWDLRTLQPKEVVESMGGSVWQLVAEHTTRIQKKTMSDEVLQSTGSSKEDEGRSDSEDVSISGSEDEPQNENREQRVALACEDGCVRIFAVADRQLGMLYRQSLPRIKGRVLSVAWTWDGTQVLAGGSDGCIRCWDIASNCEVYRITAGIGGKGSASDLCIWDLLVLRDGSIVSGDSSGSTQFWDGKQGTLIQVQTRHNADVLALAASPDHRSVFSAGADGQVVQFHWVEESSRMADNPLTSSPVDFMMRPTGDKWVYVGGKRTHTHDVRALTVAFPIINEDLPVQKRRKQLQKSKLSPQTDYRKWALSQTAMLISGGNDAKLFAYPANSFLLFYPHDISPAPERPFFQLARQSAVQSGTLMMAQHPTWVDVWNIDTYEPAPNMHHQSNAQPLKLLARIKCKLSGHITCSAISGNGCLVAVSDCQRPRLYQLEHDFTNNCVSGGKMMQICKKKLPPVLRATHCMIFSADSGRLLLAGPKLSVSVVDTKSLELVHTFQVPSETVQSKLAKAVIMLMSTSSDGQWLAAATSSGHVVVFNMETLRYHWTVPVFDGTPATAAVFHAGFSNVLIVSSAANQLYVLDVEMKVPGEWYKRYGMHIAKQLLEFPGGIVGLSLPLSPDSTSIIAYSSSAMCVIDFSKLMLDEGEEDRDRGVKAVNSQEHGNGTRELVVNGNGNGNGNGHKQNGSDVPKKSIGTRFVPFKNPVLFLGHTGFSSVFVVEKPWSEVLQQFPAPVFRHVFGT
ncbi:unnamed protein product [Sphagnum troendelagicum]|uniref:U3 small nucleolar RNA-associated protein 4 n=1 Tax=Sphagnum troendelagicum TaxID=128251 RepID=A0ABP0UMP9_9BRYO